MYDTTCSSPLPSRPPFESDDISLFLHHLLHSSSSSSTSSTLLHKPLNHSLPSPSPLHPFSSSTSTRLLDSDTITTTRVASASTDDSSTFILPTELKDLDTPIHDFEAKRRKLPVENDFDDFDCESEEGVEGSDGVMKSAPSRNSSKRSRAAEVHNLSEKRRRSRINEKMKALQNLIPNSNKTDKASMLDEAIEYLKQLQLQVQMLSMRNGFSLHPMYLPGVIQPLQLPQVRMDFNEGNALVPQMRIGRDTLPVNPESSTQTSFGLSNQCSTSNQPMVMPSMPNIAPSETSYGLDASLQGHQGSFHLSVTSEEIYREQMLRDQQFYLSQSSRNPPGDNKLKSMATTSLPFDARASVLEHTNCVEGSILHKERSQVMLPKDVDSSQSFMEHLHRRDYVYQPTILQDKAMNY